MSPREEEPNDGRAESDERQKMEPKMHFVGVVKPAIARFILRIDPRHARQIDYEAQYSRGKHVPKQTP